MLLSMRERLEVNKPYKHEKRKDLLIIKIEIYMFDSLDEKKMLYNMPFKFILNGIVDIGDLQQALDIMIERHETLRDQF